LKDWNEVNKEANKLQSAFRNSKAKKIVRTKREEKYQSHTQEAIKLQSAFRNYKAKNIVKTKRNAKNQTLSPAPMEITNTVQPARVSGVHETTRQGATTTRTFEQNQAIAQLRQQPPTRQSSGTAISNATTLPPQATGRGSALKNLKPFSSPESPEKRGRGRPPGSGAPKPMKIKYDKPGRPVLIPDPMEPEQIKTPKLRMPKKK
jgi:hypothetical protein